MDKHNNILSVWSATQFPISCKNVLCLKKSIHTCIFKLVVTCSAEGVGRDKIGYHGECERKALSSLMVTVLFVSGFHQKPCFSLHLLVI